jgi:hypothetical protein
MTVWNDRFTLAMEPVVFSGENEFDVIPGRRRENNHYDQRCGYVPWNASSTPCCGDEHAKPSEHDYKDKYAKTHRNVAM